MNYSPRIQRILAKLVALLRSHPELSERTANYFDSDQAKGGDSNG